MNDDSKFWLIIWAMAAFVVVMFMLALNEYYTGKNETIASLLKEGISPMEVYCIYGGSSAATFTCPVLLSQKQGDAE